MMLDYKRNGVAWQGATLGAAGPATCGVAAKPGVLGRQPLPGLLSPSRTRFVVVNRVYVDEKVVKSQEAKAEATVDRWLKNLELPKPDDVNTTQALRGSFAGVLTGTLLSIALSAGAATVAAGFVAAARSLLPATNVEYLKAQGVEFPGLVLTAAAITAQKGITGEADLSKRQATTVAASSAGAGLLVAFFAAKALGLLLVGSAGYTIIKRENFDVGKAATNARDFLRSKEDAGPGVAISLIALTAGKAATKLSNWLQDKPVDFDIARPSQLRRAADDSTASTPSPVNKSVFSKAVAAATSTQPPEAEEPKPAPGPAPSSTLPISVRKPRPDGEQPQQPPAKAPAPVAAGPASSLPIVVRKPKSELPAEDGEEQQEAGPVVKPATSLPIVVRKPKAEGDEEQPRAKAEAAEKVVAAGPASTLPISVGRPKIEREEEPAAPVVAAGPASTLPIVVRKPRGTGSEEAAEEGEPELVAAGSEAGTQNAAAAEAEAKAEAEAVAKAEAEAKARAEAEAEAEAKARAAAKEKAEAEAKAKAEAEVRAKAEAEAMAKAKAEADALAAAVANLKAKVEADAQAEAALEKEADAAASKAADSSPAQPADESVEAATLAVLEEQFLPVWEAIVPVPYAGVSSSALDEKIFSEVLPSKFLRRGLEQLKGGSKATPPTSGSSGGPSSKPTVLQVQALSGKGRVLQISSSAPKPSTVRGPSGSGPSQGTQVKAASQPALSSTLPVQGRPSQMRTPASAVSAPQRAASSAVPVQGRPSQMRTPGPAVSARLAAPRVSAASVTKPSFRQMGAARPQAAQAMSMSRQQQARAVSALAGGGPAAEQRQTPTEKALLAAGGGVVFGMVSLAWQLVKGASLQEPLPKLVLTGVFACIGALVLLTTFFNPPPKRATTLA